MKPKQPDLYEYLRKECPDLNAAKLWIHRWSHEMEETLPWGNAPQFSSRAMAGHVSAVLENKEYHGNYMAMKYGSELYNAAWS